MVNHLSTFKGSLWDSHDNTILRDNYNRAHRYINSVMDFKATLRYGPYAWPGGYPMYFITSDAKALSFESAREEFHQIINSIQNKSNDSWRIIGCVVNYENSDLCCDHSGKKIKPAYGDE